MRYFLVGDNCLRYRCCLDRPLIVRWQLIAPGSSLEVGTSVILCWAGDAQSVQRLARKDAMKKISNLNNLIAWSRQHCRGHVAAS
jgi:hypothetical protein